MAALAFGALTIVRNFGLVACIAQAPSLTARQQDAYFWTSVWLAMPDVAVPLDPTAGGPLPGPALARAWVLSSVEDGDVYLIFPDLAHPDGEWPVWFFGPKNPGAYGYRSFGAMLAAERVRGLQELRRR